VKFQLNFLIGCRRDYQDASFCKDNVPFIVTPVLNQEKIGNLSCTRIKIVDDKDCPGDSSEEIPGFEIIEKQVSGHFKESGIVGFEACRGYVESGYEGGCEDHDGSCEERREYG